MKFDEAFARAEMHRDWALGKAVLEYCGRSDGRWHEVASRNQCGSVVCPAGMYDTSVRWRRKKVPMEGVATCDHHRIFFPDLTGPGGKLVGCAVRMPVEMLGKKFTWKEIVEDGK